VYYLVNHKSSLLEDILLIKKKNTHFVRTSSRLYIVPESHEVWLLMLMGVVVVVVAVVVEVVVGEGGGG
jgi:hypothetical protein